MFRHRRVHQYYTQEGYNSEGVDARNRAFFLVYHVAGNTNRTVSYGFSPVETIGGQPRAAGPLLLLACGLAYSGNRSCSSLIWSCTQRSMSRNMSTWILCVVG